MNVVITFFLLIATIAQGVFIALFLNHNQVALSNFVLVCLLGAGYFGLFTYAIFNRQLNHALLERLGSGWSLRILSLIISAALVAIALDNLVFDYFQAITTSDPVIYTMLASWISLLISLSLALIESFYQRTVHLVRATSAIVTAVLGLPVMLLVNQLTTSHINPLVTHHADVFVGGSDGYKIYRIPAMVVIPQGAKLANGIRLSHDRIVIMAEARRDGALDTGVIDLVQKISNDGGKTWQQQQVICQHIIGNEQGKCGNATPVFDQVTGTLHLAYNLSGIPGNKAEGQRHHTSHVIRSRDGGLTWGESITIDVPNAVFGPGHGIVKQHAPFVNRIIIPYNTSVGGQGSSLALYSDDNGATWQQGQPLGTGNENELAETSSGEILMATRHIAGIGNPPKPNGRLFSTSIDGGNNWSKPRLDTNLATPICQASLLKGKVADNMYFLNPAHEAARVQLTLRLSTDNGVHWSQSQVITQGPAGYSQLAQLSNNDIAMLYENGALSYSQKISFGLMAPDKL